MQECAANQSTGRLVIDPPIESEFMGEQWTIRSVRKMRGYELVLSFVFDFVADRITATTNGPKRHLDFTGGVGRLRLNKGLFNEAMLAFVGNQDNHRDRLKTTDAKSA